jgi:hypothetical protein
MTRKWKIITLSLCLTNLAMLQWVIRTGEESFHAEQWLSDYKWVEGVREAEKDFGTGKLRVYSMEVVQYPSVGQPIARLTNYFTGRSNGSFEVWARRRYQPEDDLTLRVWQAELNGYNGRMTNLLRKHAQQNATNSHSAAAISHSTQGREPR